MFRFVAIYIVAAVMLCVLDSSTAEAWQLYRNGPSSILQHAIDRENRDFTFYVSDQYFDFVEQTPQPISTVHLALVHLAFANLQRDSPIPLSFVYGGTYRAWGRLEPDDDRVFDRKIYVDFTGYYFAGIALARQETSSSTVRSRAGTREVIGGTMHLNSNVLAFHHPAANSVAYVIREFLHILGIDHSSSANSVMSPREYRRASLAMDDKSALRSLYDAAPGQPENIVEVWVRRPDRASGLAGVEVSLVDRESGLSYVTLSDRNGLARFTRISAGRYLVAAREQTPTGASYLGIRPKGFLTTFYKGDDADPTNNPAEGLTLTVVAGTETVLELRVLLGTKEYDCYFPDTSIPRSDCHKVSCYDSSVHAGSSFSGWLINDAHVARYAPQHVSDTALASTGVREGIVVEPIGARSPLSVVRSAPQAESQTAITLEIAAGAAPAAYAAVCVAHGEYALVNTLVEVLDSADAVYTTNADLLPELADEFVPADAPTSVFVTGKYTAEWENSEVERTAAQERGEHPAARQKETTEEKALSIICGVVGGGEGRQQTAALTSYAQDSSGHQSGGPSLAKAGLYVVNLGLMQWLLLAIVPILAVSRWTLRILRQTVSAFAARA